jgi:hypothetical protein
MFSGHPAGQGAPRNPHKGLFSQESLAGPRGVGHAAALATVCPHPLARLADRMLDEAARQGS